MKPFPRSGAVLALAFLPILLFAFGCGQACSPGHRPTITLMSYNVHNLFDARDSGQEYPEFSVRTGRWNEAKYKARLEALAQVVRAACESTKGPDILCLVEVENQAILEEARKGVLASSAYIASALVPAPGQAVNCGILSRFPIRELNAHGLKAGARGGRYILEASLETGSGTLVVFVNHWKSRIEGPEATEGERREAAALLADRMAAIIAADPGAEVLACGDFNEGPDDYERMGRAWPTAFMPVAEAGKAVDNNNCIYIAGSPGEAGLLPWGRPVLYSPWEGSDAWSYVNKGERERLDGFLIGPGLLDGKGLAFTGFHTLGADFLLDSKGFPLAYSPTRGSGYSDHLPLILELAILADGP